MYNGTGTLFAKYNYDAWGNIISVTNASGVEVSDNHIAKLQPFRYRSYYYDTESGFYYLQSRYYDPVTHRFINSDSLMDESDILGYNLFAYCLNNPIMSSYPLGLCAIAWSQGLQGPCPGQGKPGCMDNRYRDVTKEVDEALIPAAEQGKSLRETLYPSTFVNDFNSTIINETYIYTEFYCLVNHEAPWDIKREDPWKNTIGTEYPGQNVLIIYHDSLTTVEELGNYTYGYLGYSYGIPLNTLYAGSYYAAGLPVNKTDFNHEVGEDWVEIKKGYMVAK